MNTLYEHLADYVHLSARITSRKTHERYQAALNAYAAFLIRPPTAADLTPENMAAFIRHRRQLGRSPNTIRGECAKILALWRWLSRHKLADWPEVELPRGLHQMPLAWSREQLDRLWECAYTYQNCIKQIPGDLVMPCLLSVIWDSAERIGAVHPLRWERIEWESRWVTFVATERKGGIREHVARLSPATMRSLRRLQAAHLTPAGGPFLFCDRATLYYHLEKLLLAAGLPTDAKSKFHRLRRSHATHLHLAGGDATASLGHWSDSETRRSYLDVRLLGHKTAEKLLFRPGRRLRTVWRILLG